MISIIPTNENYEKFSYSTFRVNFTRFRETLDSYYAQYLYNVYTHAYNPLTAVLELTASIDAMNCEDTDKNVLQMYYVHNAPNVRLVATDSYYRNSIGIVINIGSERAYNEQNFQGVILGEASKAIKGKTKFFKIFHREDNPNLLFVWSSGHLTIDQFYKLKVLQNVLNKRNLEKFNPYTEELYKAFEAQDLEKLNAVINDLLSSEYFKDKEYKMFKRIFNNRSKRREDSYKETIERGYMRIQQYENQIAAEAQKIQEYNEKLFGLMNNQKNDEDYKFIYKYIHKHKHITDISYENNSIKFTFRAPIVYYTDYAIEKILYRYESDSIKYNVLKLFLDKKIELITECTIRFYPETFSIDALAGTCNNEHIIGHPHIDQYSCLGNHREGIAESAETNDYIGAIEQINQAVMNMNFYDACVTQHLLNTLAAHNVYDSKETWRDKETGEMITTKEAIRRSGYNEETETDNNGEEQLPI